MLRGRKADTARLTEHSNFSHNDIEDKYTRKREIGVAAWVTKYVLAGGGLLIAPILIMVANKNKVSQAPVDIVSTQQESSVEIAKREALLVSRGRFPTYGTEEFNKQCKWTRVQDDSQSQQQPQCIYFVTPKPTEGISSWACYVAEAYIVSRLKGCKLLFQYDPGIDIQQVITPYNDHQLNNWTVPDGFKCDRQNNCTVAGVHFDTARELLPHYRFAYMMEKYAVHRKEYATIEGSLDGFHLETGIACSLGVLFKLASTASLFEPRLYTDLLPRVRNAHNLVIAIYIRTSFTDVKAKNSTAEEDKKKYLIIAQRPIDCALSVEKKYLSKFPELKSSVWMVVSDSQVVKQDVQERYNGKEVKTQNNLTDIRREVLSTGSRGTHSRPNISPSTADFAEAMIDWYMIGESDVAIVQSATFGFTAGLRTARPFYGAHSCKEQILVH